MQDVLILMPFRLMVATLVLIRVAVAARPYIFIVCSKCQPFSELRPRAQRERCDLQVLVAKILFKRDKRR